MNRKLYSGLVLWCLLMVVPSNVLAEGKIKFEGQSGHGQRYVRPPLLPVHAGQPTSTLQRWKKARHLRGKQVTAVPELDPRGSGQTLLLLAGAGWLALGNTRRRLTA